MACLLRLGNYLQEREVSDKPSASEQRTVSGAVEDFTRMYISKYFQIMPCPKPVNHKIIEYSVLAENFKGNELFSIGVHRC